MWSYFVTASLLIGICSSEPSLKCSEENVAKLSDSIKNCTKPLVSYGFSVISELMGEVKKETLIRLCRLLKDFSTCTTAVVTKTNCIDESIKKISYDAIHSTDVGVAYACANDAEIANEFFTNKGVSCIISTMGSMKKCVTETVQPVDYQGFLAKPNLEHLQVFCNISEPGKKCILDPIEAKPDKCHNCVVEIVHEVLERMHEGLPCGYKRPESEPKSNVESEPKSNVESEPKSNVTDKKKGNNGASNFCYLLPLLVLSLVLPFV